jgi:hypothetical protein
MVKWTKDSDTSIDPIRRSASNASFSHEGDRIAVLPHPPERAAEGPGRPERPERKRVKTKQKQREPKYNETSFEGASR